MKAKKKPQDSTFRNVRAAKKRITALTNVVKKLEKRVKKLEAKK